MVKLFRTAAGLLATALVLAQAPEALAQQGSTKAAPAGKAAAPAKARKKNRKAAKPVARQSAAPAAAPAPRLPTTEAERAVLEARAAAAVDLKEAITNNLPIREVNGVQMPSNRSVLDNLRLSLDHTIFFGWFQRSNLAEKLARQKFTLLAPSNDAIKADPNLSSFVERSLPKEVLMGFVLEGEVELLKMEEGSELKITSGEACRVMRKDDTIFLQVGEKKQVGVGTPDIKCSNGYLNLIDGTLSDSQSAGSIRKGR